MFKAALRVNKINALGPRKAGRAPLGPPVPGAVVGMGAVARWVVL